jgi:hypothetical protein
VCGSSGVVVLITERKHAAHAQTIASRGVQ